ncbi:hypothetical protein [Micromonospora sp. KC723]|uniref:hypothetical protein n=1 Tax=Micromonospora sp. KC723 TaxID=2530381 RepID=UPI001050046E|nr:hypothetical protein [Micromonospora sp. KC723]TDB73711.1 hypothetical protein E1165_16465 [Micromonospora sp. KC723]
MIGHGFRALVGLLFVPALVACSAVGDIRRDPPAPTSTSPRPVVPDPSPSVTPAEVRRFRVAVPDRYDDPYVEFSDADRGWALYAGCDGRPPDRDCPALLFTTADGGRAWREVRHPRPVADNQQLYCAPGLVVLWAEPHGFYASTDNGGGFTRSGEEVATAAADLGRYRIIERLGKVGEWDGRRLRPLAAQPDIPAIATVGGDGRLVVAAGTVDGRPYAAVSVDRGRRWRPTPVPAVDGEVGLVRAVVDADGAAWLVGERPDRTSWPALWRWGRKWEPVRIDDPPAQVTAVAPLGGGLLAVTSSRGVGVVGGGAGYVDLAWPLVPGQHMRTLADGTLAVPGPPGEVLLGVGNRLARRWIRVTVTGE